MTSTVFHARLIAPHARRWLSHAGERRVLHVFERVCNLVDGRGEVVSLISPPLGSDPLAILLSDSVDFTRRVDAANSVIITPQRIQIGTLHIHFSTTQDWNPQPDWQTAHAHLEPAYPLLLIIAELMRQYAPSDSFAVLATGETGAGASEYEAGQMRAIEAAREPVQRLVEGIRAGKVETSIAAAEKLAGLGGGLTPSGDDFLVGALHALWLLRPAEAAGLATKVADWASPRTTRLSAAWLKAAARGEAGSLWHTFIDVLSAGDQAGVEAAVRHIIRVGHTSGADALAGFIAVLKKE